MSPAAASTQFSSAPRGLGMISAAATHALVEVGQVSVRTGSPVPPIGVRRAPGQFRISARNAEIIAALEASDRGPRPTVRISAGVKSLAGAAALRGATKGNVRQAPGRPGTAAT